MGRRIVLSPPTCPQEAGLPRQRHWGRPPRSGSTFRSPEPPHQLLLAALLRAPSVFTARSCSTVSSSRDRINDPSGKGMPPRSSGATSGSGPAWLSRAGISARSNRVPRAATHRDRPAQGVMLQTVAGGGDNRTDLRRCVAAEDRLLQKPSFRNWRVLALRRDSSRVAVTTGECPRSMRRVAPFAHEHQGRYASLREGLRPPLTLSAPGARSRDRGHPPPTSRAAMPQLWTS